MKIKVNDCFLAPSRIVVGVKGSLGEPTLELSFGREWDGLDKSVFFRTSTGVSVSAGCESGVVRIPDEVMESHGKVRFAVLGKGDGKRKTTLSGELYVLDTVDEVE